MRLFLSLAVITCGWGPGRGDPGKIIVDDTNKVDDKRWKPYDVRLHREERVHGEVVVLSPPLFVRGPPKGFPFKLRTRRESQGHRSDHGGRTHVKSPGTGTLRELENFEFPRGKRSTSQGRLSGRQNRLPDVYQQSPRHPSYYQPGRVQGEVIVHSSSLSIKGPPKGYPLRRKTRQAPENGQENQNATHLPITPKPSQFSIKNPGENSPATQQLALELKPVKRTSTSSVVPNPEKSLNSTSVVYRKGTKLKPPKGRHSMMKMLKDMWPYMLVPTMMTLGYAPFVLSSVKMFVMNALMLNFMALNAAIMLTLRNMVFGPRIGGHTKYVNYGYQQPHHHGHHHHYGDGR